MTIIYILKCQNNKYYVGRTDRESINKRIDQHKKGKILFTKINHIICIEEKIYDADDFDEDKYVKKYMKKYGINNVRGGTYSQMDLSEDKIQCIKDEICTSDERCYGCGKAGHYINRCSKVRIEKNKSKKEINNSFPISLL